MDKNKAFTGVMTAIATPFFKQNDDFPLDSPSFSKLVQHQKDSGIHGIVVAGTTGEGPTLSFEEKIKLLETALPFQSENFRIYIGTGTNDTAKTVEEVKKFANFTHRGAHVDGIMVVTPYYNKPSQEGLFKHFSAATQCAPNFSFCVYNVPGRTSVNLDPATLLNLAKSFNNIVAIKEAAGDVKAITELAKKVKSLTRKFEILSGDDPTFAPALACGATGVISVTTHIIPRLMLEIYNSWNNSDTKALLKAHLDAQTVNKDLFCVPNPIALKYALKKLGHCENLLRPPMTPLDESFYSIVDSALSSIQK